MSALSPRNTAPLATVDRLRERFKEYYDSHLADHTKPYPGIPELSGAAEQGVAIAVASNKYQEAVTRLMEVYFPDTNVLVAAEGNRPGVPTKP